MNSEIVKRAKAGDGQALEELYRETRQMVYFTALGIVKNEDDAEDLVQDTYIKAFENLARLQEEKAFLTWLKTIVIHISKNYLKKRKPMLFQDDEEEDAVIGSIEEVGEDFLPQEYLEQEEKQKTIKDIIFDLPDAQRIAVTLYYYSELTLSEVSKIMETANGTTKSRLNYARKQIKAKVDEQEKQGNKMYVSVPMLTRILHMVSKQYDLPAEAAKHILANSLPAANLAAPAASSAAGSGAAGQAVAESASGALEGTAGTVGKSAAVKGLLAKVAGLSIQTKVIALITTAAVITGGTGAAVAVKKHGDAVQAAIVLQQEKEREAKAASEAAAEKAASEAAESKAASEAAEQEAASSSEAESSSESAASATLSEQDRQIYKALYDANFKDKAKAVFFADLTHDGKDEMLVVYTDPSIEYENGVLDIYTISNNTPKKIFTKSVNVSHPGYGEEDLYQKNGLDYLFEPYDPQPNAYGDNVLARVMIGYSIFSLDPSGNKQVCKSDAYGDTEYMDGHIVYDQKGGAAEQKQHQKAVQQAMKDYAAKSTLLLSSIRDLNMSYGQGVPDPFGESASSSSASSSSASSQAESSGENMVDRDDLYTATGEVWSGDNNDYQESMNFNKDGTMDYDCTYNQVEKVYDGTYQIAGNQMTVHLAESKYNPSLKKDVPISNGKIISAVYSMKLENGKLTLTLESGTPMSSYQKTGEAATYDILIVD